MSKKQPTQEQPKKKLSLDGEYPGLNGLSWGIGYLEQFLAIISEPLLIACASLAVIDFITGGKLLALPFLMYLWAGSLAIAVTACFIVTWRRSIRAFTYNRYGIGLGLALLGIILGVVDWAAIDVQSLQQTIGVSFSTALSQLNLDVIWLTHIRSAVAISMAVVVALSNHTAVTTAQAPKRRLALFEQLMDRVAPKVSTGVTTPAQVVITEETAQPLKQLEAERGTRLHVVEANAELMPLERVRRVLSDNPTCSDRELGRLTSLAPATAKKYRQQLNGDHSQAG